MQNRTKGRIEPFEPFLWVYYIWYYFPMVRAFFKSGTYNLIFFTFFLVGCAGIFAVSLYRRQKIYLQFNALTPVLVYMFVFCVMVFLGMGEADEHIRISFTFWGSLLVFYLLRPYENARNRLAALLLVMLAITAVTSIAGVIMNPNAARILAYSANPLEEDLILRMMNIGGIYFFQGLVVCVPIFMTFVFEKYKPVIAIISLVAVILSLTFASFTIAIILFFVAFALSYLLNTSSIKRGFLVVFAVLLLILIPWVDLIELVADNIGNEKISLRLTAIARSISYGSAVGNLESRIEVYSVSWKTFLNNPFGSGPRYTYVTFEDGIGYHSQILDDLARYGIFAILFYFVFLVKYTQLLKTQWRKIGMSQVALPTVITYTLFLFFNPGFTSAHEGALLMYLIPVLPDLIKSTRSMQLKNSDVS